MQQAAQQCQSLQCELCQAREKAGSSPGAAKVGATQASARAYGGRKLNILCLHGFRQDARLMQDSLAWFQREFADIVQLEFAEAPHILPWLYRPTSGQGTSWASVHFSLLNPNVCIWYSLHHCLGLPTFQYYPGSQSTDPSQNLVAKKNSLCRRKQGASKN